MAAAQPMRPPPRAGGFSDATAKDQMMTDESQPPMEAPTTSLPEAQRSMVDWMEATAKQLGVQMFNRPPLPEAVQMFNRAQDEAPSYHFAVDLAQDSTPQLFSASKQGYLVKVSNEELENAEVWPVFLTTPLSAEEREARIEAELERCRQEQAPILARLATAHPALQPVIELHSPDGENCTGCDAGAWAEADPDWPCSTIDLILEGLE